MPISQEYGHTEFSLSQPTMYRYGLAYGLDGRAHPGIDVGMPAGTPLYAPVDAEVVVAGGTPYFTYYGNGEPGVGELLLRTASGHEVVLGHMGLIVVGRGQQLTAGEFVGLSGGDNGDHLHLEVREAQAGGGFRTVDPRYSFLTAALESEATVRQPNALTAGDDVPPSGPAPDSAAPLGAVDPTRADAASLPKADSNNVQTVLASTGPSSNSINRPMPGTVRKPPLE